LLSFRRLLLSFYPPIRSKRSNKLRERACGGGRAVLASAAVNGSDYDLAIIGGGINGCGIARDAAGRGWRVFLCDRADLGAGTSSASTKLIHGGLRYLEHYEFRLVREALMEREVLWGIAPHIIWPLRFVLPHHRKLRAAWLLRLGLFIYDHLGGRKRLPPTRTVRLRSDPVGAVLKPEFSLGFEYSDCWVEDSRLVVLNARDAADRGATIAPRTACLSASRTDGAWALDLRDETTGERRAIRAGALVNAAGPWVADVAGSVIRANVPAAVRLVQGSHIVVRKLYDHAACYIFQNADGRIFFVIPYERDFTLIGTTDADFTGDPSGVHASEAEIAYLCRSASAYLRVPVTPDMAVWSYSGVRALFDDGSAAPQEATRDYVLKLDAPADAPALLSVFGGKITTYRRLAESALAMLAPHLPRASGKPGWTARQPLPGGDFPMDGFDAQLATAEARYPFLPKPTVRRLLRAYGTRIHAVLNGAACYADLGRVFGADLTEAELRYLAQAEWVRSAEDAVWRRSKLGLRLSAAEIASIDDALHSIGQERMAAA
jgi:glycerol-3-phosphate dehydrogenase